jgi:dehydrogenase/reductase SDR family member 7B
MKNKVIIITGASSGIGKALAFECARRGARLVLAARDMDKLSGIATELKQFGSEVLLVQTDVAVESQCKNLVDKTLEKFGRIDVLVNNAGISMRAIFEDVELDVLRKLMDTNFWGTAYCTKFAFKALLESKGSLIAVSSVAGIKGLPARSGYSASKFAIHGMLEVIRNETQKQGLHVLIACPGFTSTNIRFTALSKDGTAQGESPRDESKMMTAEETAVRMCHAIEKRKRTLVLTTQGKFVFFMNKIWPSMVDKIIYNHMAKEPNTPLKNK